MEEELEVTAALRQVIKEERVDKLSEFEEPLVWKGLRKLERRALAKLFFQRGKHQYESEDEESICSLKLATDLFPDFSDAWLFLAKGYLKFYKNPDELQQGLIAILCAHELDIQSLEINLQLAHILSELGVLIQSLELLGDADKIFNKLYIDHKEEKLLNSNFFWFWGLSCHHLGKLAGEPSDYKRAISIYKMAWGLGENDYRFYRDHGLALLELGILLNQIDYFFQAVPIIRKALELDPESPEVWQAFARLKHILFDTIGDVSHAEDALVAYARADRLVVSDSTFLFQWGELLYNVGRFENKEAYVEESFVKFQRITADDPLYPKMLRILAEAELFASDQKKGDLQLIRKAEDHVKESLRLAPDNVQGWLTYGSCMTELGRYFSDDSFYLQAIEKFQTGITIQENHPFLWHGMALAHFVLGETRGDIHMLKKAAAYCSRLMEFGGEAFPQFWNDWAVVLLKIGEQTHDAKVLYGAKEKFEHAIALFQKKRDISKINPACLNHYGSCLDLLGEIEEEVVFHESAVEVLCQAMILDPDCVDIRYNYAFALVHLAEISSDLDIYGQAVEQFRTLTEYDAEDDMSWHDWGVTLMRMAELAEDPAMPGQPEVLRVEAKEKFLTAAALGYTHSYYSLARLHAQMEDLSTTLSYLKKADEADSLPPMEDLLNDPCLENVRSTLEFRLFIERYTQ